jgi:hypothetical protein
MLPQRLFTPNAQREIGPDRGHCVVRLLRPSRHASKFKLTARSESILHEKPRPERAG